MKPKKLAPGETRAIAVAVGITRRDDDGWMESCFGRIVGASIIRCY